MKNLYLVVIALVACTLPLHAAVLQLNNGSVVNGRVIERTQDRVRMDVGGVVLTYYNDEIASFQGDEEVVVEPVSAAIPAVSKRESFTPSDDKSALVLKFVELFGTKAAMTQNLDQMIASLPPDQADSFRKAFSVTEIIDLLVPLYEKYFSVEDLQAYIEFYSSPSGRKLVGNIPSIMQESVAVSSKYFEENMPQNLRGATDPVQE